jgi:hypothetical protein
MNNYDRFEPDELITESRSKPRRHSGNDFSRSKHAPSAFVAEDGASRVRWVALVSPPGK